MRLRSWGENPENFDWLLAWIAPGVRVSTSEGHSVSGVQEVMIGAKGHFKLTAQDVDEFNFTVQSVEFLASRSARGNLRVEHFDAALVAR